MTERYGLPASSLPAVRGVESEPVACVVRCSHRRQLWPGFLRSQCDIRSRDDCWGCCVRCDDDTPPICVQSKPRQLSRGCAIFNTATKTYHSLRISTRPPDSITKPDLPLRVLKNTLVEEHTSRNLEEKLKQRYWKATLEKALADRPEIGECPGPKGFHEWGSSESLYDGYTKVVLQSCQHCSVHLLSDFRGYGRNDLFFSEEPDPEWGLLSLEADPRQCEHRSHEHGFWYESCPECGVSNPY